MIMRRMWKGSRPWRIRLLDDSDYSWIVHSGITQCVCCIHQMRRQSFLFSNSLCLPGEWAVRADVRFDCKRDAMWEMVAFGDTRLNQCTPYSSILIQWGGGYREQVRRCKTWFELILNWLEIYWLKTWINIRLGLTIPRHTMENPYPMAQSVLSAPPCDNPKGILICI